MVSSPGTDPARPLRGQTAAAGLWRGKNGIECRPCGCLQLRLDRASSKGVIILRLEIDSQDGLDQRPTAPPTIRSITSLSPLHCGTSVSTILKKASRFSNPRCSWPCTVERHAGCSLRASDGEAGNDPVVLRFSVSIAERATIDPGGISVFLQKPDAGLDLGPLARAEPASCQLISCAYSGIPAIDRASSASHHRA